MHASGRPAIVLLSGGVDSTTVLALARAKGFLPYALTVRYGQRHALEIDAAVRIARAFEVAEHKILDLDLRPIGGSALTDDIEVPKGRDAESIGTGIPVTYVPARNTIFLSLALAWAEVLAATDLFIGVNALDYSGYPDCRPEFIEAFERVAAVGTRAGVQNTDPIRVHTPLIRMTKREILRTGLGLGVDYGMTISCYEPAPEGACGMCDACHLRRNGFAELGRDDPAVYRDPAGAR